MRIYWATRLRGFLKHISDGLEGVTFIDSNSYYEVNNVKSKLLSKMIRNPIFNLIGLFSVVSVQGKECDGYASFNRFLKCDKPYFIYLENPTALYHYTLKRISFPLGRRRFSSCLKDPYLRAIVCMSNACKNSFKEVNRIKELSPKFLTIYPLVPTNNNVNYNYVKKKSYNKTLELLYCVQGISFISKGGLEVLEAFRRLNNSNMHLTIITSVDVVDSKIINKIHNMENVSLHDFNYSYDELEKVYANTNVLIQPTSNDSFALTILEAMKAGCAIITSKLYAIPEMVEDGKNGFLVEPKYWFFDENNIPNPKVWNHRKRTIYSEELSENLIDELIDKISSLHNNREMLSNMSIESYNKANDDSLFGENGIKDKWTTLLNEIFN